MVPTTWLPRRVERARKVALDVVTAGLVGGASDAMAAIRKGIASTDARIAVKAGDVWLSRMLAFEQHRIGNEELAELKAKVAALEAAKAAAEGVAP